MEKSNVKITFQGNPLTLLGKEVKVGDVAPDFTVSGGDLSPVKLSDYKGKVVVLSVFPSIDTPVCAAQTRTFNKEAVSLSGDVAVLGLSNDLPFALGRFCAAEGIDNVVTLSDHKDVDFGAKYGFLIEELRLLSRGIVVVDQAGVVRYVEYLAEITEEPNYEAAIAAVKALV